MASGGCLMFGQAKEEEGGEKERERCDEDDRGGSSPAV